MKKGSCIVKLISNTMDDSDREMLVVVAIDTKNRPFALEVCSNCSLNSQIVHVKEVLKRAILAKAESIIVPHNHSSGNVLYY